MMLLPQRPYIPIGHAARRRHLSGRRRAPTTMRRSREALRAARLPHLADRLDEERFWAQTLSLGEQQRLAHRPGAPRQAGLALPRRGDGGARRADRGGDIPDAPRAAAGHDRGLDRPPLDAAAFHERRIDMQRGRTASSRRRERRSAAARWRPGGQISSRASARSAARRSGS